MRWLQASMSEYADVIKKHACPACGAEGVMRFRCSEATMEAPCSGCGMLIRLERKEHNASGPLSSSYNDSWTDLEQTV